MMISYDRNMWEFLNVFSVLIIDTESVILRKVHLLEQIKIVNENAR
jgi:hypothetical protein